MFKLKRVLPLLALLALALSPMSAASAAVRPAGDGYLELVSPMQQGTEPVTIYAATTELVQTYDPQLAQDTYSISPIENLFLGLTDLDPQTTEPRPELATSWEADATEEVWTFTLRSDVPWVRYDPASGQTTEIRKVVAEDFVYGLKRACDPRTGSYYSNIAAAMIKGCDVVFRTPIARLNDATFDQVAVKALSDTQLEITLQGPFAFWRSASSMWIFRATPREAIEEFGDRWIEPGNIITNGPFVLAEWDRNVNRIFLKNPLYPTDVNDNYGGNVERVSTIVVGDGGTIYSLYQNNEVDSSGVPEAELQRILQDPKLSKEVQQASDLVVSYFGFSYDKAPFDNVHVRRAFSAALDRATMINELLPGRGVPMAHFTPPGIFGAPPLNEVGVGQPDTPGYDPEFARKELELGGFPNCEGLPEITILSGGAFATYLQNAMQALGCDPSKFILEDVDFQTLLKSIEPTVPTAQRPHLWALAWGPDYPDAHNWVHDVLSCKAQNNFKRPCSEAIDGLIDEAAKETDPDKRIEMYRQIEEAFFGPEGEFPIIPIVLSVNKFLVKPWYTGFWDTDGLFGGPHWNTRTIDQAAQLAARPAR